jgi:hypothetical protein
LHISSSLSSSSSLLSLSPSSSSSSSSSSLIFYHYYLMTCVIKSSFVCVYQVGLFAKKLHLTGLVRDAPKLSLPAKLVFPRYCYSLFFFFFSMMWKPLVWEKTLLQFYLFHGSILGSIHILGQWSSYNRTWFIGPLSRNSNLNSNLGKICRLMSLVLSFTFWSNWCTSYFTVVEVNPQAFK